MASPCVLVADGNISTLNQTRHALEEEGYRVEIAGDGRDALARAKELQPDLMIVALDLPKVNGWKVLKRVRAIGGLDALPVLFIADRASDSLERKAMKVGVEDMLFRPVHPETLAFRVARALSRRYKVEQVHRTLKKTADTRRLLAEKLKAKASPPESLEPPSAAAVPRPATAPGTPDAPALAGSLEHITFPTVLTMLEVEHKTGRLTLVNGHDGSAGWCELRDGRVVRAALDGDDLYRNREAVLRMLTWAAGGFNFQVEPVEGKDEIGAATTELLIEGARFTDESGVFESPL